MMGKVMTEIKTLAKELKESHGKQENGKQNFRVRDQRQTRGDRRERRPLH